MARRAERAAFSGGRIVGIDPGQHTGIVCIDVPSTLEMREARWVGSTVVNAPSSTSLTEPELDALMLERIEAALSRLAPDAIVLEEPLDAQVGWGGRGYGKQARGTAFRLGCYYGLAVSAASCVRHLNGVGRAPIDSYPVTNSHRRPGWMMGMTHEMVLLRAKDLLHDAGAPDDLSDHEYMAAGVVAFHLQRLRGERQLRERPGRQRVPLGAR